MFAVGEIKKTFLEKYTLCSHFSMPKVWKERENLDDIKAISWKTYWPVVVIKLLKTQVDLVIE
jgi:hypothetical protein